MLFVDLIHLAFRCAYSMSDARIASAAAAGISASKIVGGQAALAAPVKMRLEPGRG